MTNPMGTLHHLHANTITSRLLLLHNGNRRSHHQFQSFYTGITRRTPTIKSIRRLVHVQAATSSVHDIIDKNYRPQCTAAVHKKSMIQCRFHSSSEMVVDDPNWKNKPYQEIDFFGEPITFLHDNKNNDTIIDPAKVTESHDEYLVGVITRGKSCKGGGGDEGLDLQAAHSMAIIWSKLFHCAWDLRSNAPMLGVAAVAPLLANAGVRYVEQVDDMLRRGAAAAVGDEQQDEVALQFMDLARGILDEFGDNDKMLTQRERMHLKILSNLLKDNRRKALADIMVLLCVCPGDALAMHCGLELAHSLGDARAAMKLGGNAAAYWNERSQLGIMHAPGYFIGSSMIALGLSSVGGAGNAVAERLAVVALNKDDDNTGGLASYALAHVFESEGRSSEGNSAIIGSDGAENVEGCGHLFFDSKLMGIGARFALDRDGLDVEKTVVRLYDVSFSRVLSYHDVDSHETTSTSLRHVPGNVRSGVRGVANTIMGKFNLFGSTTSTKDPKEDTDDNSNESVDAASPKPFSTEDVLTWLPPTPQLLTDATLLLLRMTISGFVNGDDIRWHALRRAWKVLVENPDRSQFKDGNCGPVSVLQSMPLAYVASSLLLEECADNISEINKIVSLCGRMMRLGRHANDENNNYEIFDDDEAWQDLAQKIYQLEQSTEAWDLDSRAFFERLVCHVACMSDDYDTICLARAVCSESITLRSNSPEVWWRYGIVLDKLGDHEAADNARSTSISLGRGEGGKFG